MRTIYLKPTEQMTARRRITPNICITIKPTSPLELLPSPNHHLPTTNIPLKIPTPTKNITIYSKTIMSSIEYWAIVAEYKTPPQHNLQNTNSSQTHRRPSHQTNTHGHRRATLAIRHHQDPSTTTSPLTTRSRWPIIEFPSQSFLIGILHHTLQRWSYGGPSKPDREEFGRTVSCSW